MVKAIQAAGWTWPGMQQDALAHCQRCQPCLQHNLRQTIHHPLQPIHADKPFDHVAVDLAGPFQTSPSGNNFLHIMVDVHTRTVVLKPIPDKRMETTADTWLDAFTTFGFPRIVQSDNGTEFVNKVVAAMASGGKFTHRLISRYHPRANGLAERMVQSVKQLLRKLVEGKKNEWDKHIPFIQFCLNQHITSAHGKAPFMAMFGRSSGELCNHQGVAVIAKDESVEALEACIKWMQEELFPETSKSLAVTQAKKKKKFDKRSKLVEIPVGEFVILRNEERKDTLDPRYQGPYKVMSRTPTGAYSLEDRMGLILLNNYPMSALQPLSSYAPPDNKNYEVKAIMQHKKVKGGYEYLVRWKGYNADQDTWEPARNFNTKEAIDVYWKRRGSPTRRG